ncbi:MAG: sigma-70 family RNA polymerase sigma factor [Chitinophagaceae bacterium]|nr:sigma-70 family RNA polymerase sigma factor [Chitinophagaceae bacterium]
MQASSLSSSKISTEPSPHNIRLYNDLYAKYHKVIYINIRKFVHSPEGVEDVFQDVFLALWENLHKVKSVESIAPWLFVVSQHKALSYLKRKVNDSLILVDSYQPFETIPAAAADKTGNDIQMAMINRAIEQLPDKRKRVFTLSKFEGLTVDEIASELEITPSTVREYLKQSVRSIKSYLDTASRQPALSASAVLLLLLID